MRHFAFYQAISRIVISSLCYLLPAAMLAQTSPLADYVLYGGAASCRHYSGQSDCIVQIGHSSYISGGYTGSNHLVKTSNGVLFTGSILSDGLVKLGARNTVNASIYASNKYHYSGAAIKTYNYTKITGNLHAKGDIYIGDNSSVGGLVVHPAGTTYRGPAPAGGENTTYPIIPPVPEMPAITAFAAAGNANVYGGGIGPGQYGSLKLRGDKTICLSGTGDYTFSDISNSGATNTIEFDFKNDPDGIIRLFIHGDADLGSMRVIFKNGGDASRVYTEVHGDGKTCHDRRSAFKVLSGPGTHAASLSWAGTVWAPNGDISIGSGDGCAAIAGALWSRHALSIGCNVKISFVPLNYCRRPDVFAGADTVLNMLTTTRLVGSSSTPGVAFQWQALEGGKIVSGENSATAEISQAGVYVITASTGASCTASDTVIVSGKGRDIIGSELKSLYTSNDTSSALSKSIFLISNDSVFIEVIAIEGAYDEILALLQTPEYGLTDIITNGDSRLIITGKYPIANLLKLEALSDRINFCRPLYPPVTNAGISQTAGDSAMRTNYVRNGFRVQGDSIKVGVLSDSYNTLPGNAAARDVQNGDLPGAGNPQNTSPVRLLKEYPYGRRSDEGRAMLQIIHDVAPAARLSFRTGFVSAGDFAQGIRELAADACKVIVDDISFLTEPFFREGVIDSAIREATAAGVVYVATAGNFGNKSYGSVFNPAPAPQNMPGLAHNFGNGDVLQSDSLKGTALTPGIYTIVLQWEDDIYSLSAHGTRNDLDIYLADDEGHPILGYNRNNLGGDPMEVLPFTVSENTVANILVVNASPNPTPGLRFKYVVFRGDLTINEHPSEPSTIVGHSNSPDAITVGAARYSRTPAYGLSVPQLESFSSTGGTVMANGQLSQKPDIIGPDGGNTTIDFGNLDAEGDGLPNFYGTSAAAPHVAGAVALLLEAEKKYYNRGISAADVKNTLLANTIDMDSPGFDYRSGHGFIQADEALRSLANPTPEISRLEFLDTTLVPGQQPMEVIIHGHYFSPQTKVIFGNDTLPTQITNGNLGSAILPVFYSSKLIRAYTPSKSPSALDGGLSNSIAIDGIPKKNVTVVANSTTKKYGESLPAFTATILVDGDSLQFSGLSLSELGLDSISYSSPATDTSSIGLYYVRPARIAGVDDSLMMEKYNYAFTDGALRIEPLPITIIARDTTVVYGQDPGNFSFDYVVDASAHLADPQSLLQQVKETHEEQTDDAILGLVNGQAVIIVNGQAVQIVNGQAVQIVNGQAVVIINGQAVQIVNGQAVQIVNGQAVLIVNQLTEAQVNGMSAMATPASLQAARDFTFFNETGQPDGNNRRVLDVTQESILQFNTNSAQTHLLQSVNGAQPHGLVDQASIVNGQALTIVNGQAVQIVNGQALTIVNGQAVQIVNGQAVTIVNGQAVPIVNGDSRSAVIIDAADIGAGTNTFRSLNMVTGLDAGTQYIIPAAMMNENFNISYGTGKLHITPAPLTIALADTSKKYGTQMMLDSTAFRITEGALFYQDTIRYISRTSTGTKADALPGNYPIEAGNIVASANTYLGNYDIHFTPGVLAVSKSKLLVSARDTSRVYGDPNPDFVPVYEGLLPGDTEASLDGQPFLYTHAGIGSDVGYYTIKVQQGSLRSDVYEFEFRPGKMAITPAPLHVKADDKMSFRYQRLPEFTSTLCYLRAGDRAWVNYRLDPHCAGDPGVYRIIPELKHFKEKNNYTITYSYGYLYINPRCGDARMLRTGLSCVEKTGPGKYVAHFYAVNNNRTPVYLPHGIYNFLFSFGRYDSRELPALFPPGTTRFSIPFDGSGLLWNVSSYQGCYLKADQAIASAWSPSCERTGWQDKLAVSPFAPPQMSGGTIPGLTATPHVEIAAGKPAVTATQPTVYPNPAQAQATVLVPGSKISMNSIRLMDVSGREYAVRVSKVLSDDSFVLDVSRLKAGTYLLKIKTADGFVTVVLIKT